MKHKTTKESRHRIPEEHEYKTMKFILWKRKINSLKTNPMEAWLNNKGWLNLLKGSKISRKKILKDFHPINRYMIEDQIRKYPGIYDVQNYSVNRLNGRAKFGDYLNTILVKNNRKVDWMTFQSSKKAN